jgi:O-antigen chain-terminating methyltransferase
VVIEEGAWVSSNAVIVAPCRVGAHSVVGVGSLVMRDVQPYTVVAGSPARVLRHIPRPHEPTADVAPEAGTADVQPGAGTAAGAAGGQMTCGHGADGHPRRPADGDVHTDIAALAQTVTDLQQRMVALEAELRRRREGRYTGGAGSGRSRFAAGYHEFTDRFRGSTAEVSAKLEGYLPDVRRIVGAAGVLDLGCGRGEWLMLLRDAGVPARGVEANPTLVHAGHARGLDIALGDAIAHLQGLAPGSVDMVTAFHVIEHLDIEELLAVLAAAWAALRPGGCLLLETPNPANLVMAACDFYNDPTHRSPLPAALTEYLLSAQGFTDIEVRPLHPKPSPLVSPAADGAVAELQAVVSRLLFGPQDYAVLGYKTHHHAGIR